MRRTIDGMGDGEPWRRLFWSPRAIAAWAADPLRGGIAGITAAVAATAPLPAIILANELGESVGEIVQDLVNFALVSSAVITAIAALVAAAGTLARVILLSWTPLLAPLWCFYGWAIYHTLRYAPSLAGYATSRWLPQGVELWIHTTIGSCWWLLACLAGWLFIVSRAGVIAITNGVEGD